MWSFRPRRKRNEADFATIKRGPRKAGPQALWGKERQGNAVWNARRAFHTEWTLPRRRGGVLVSTGVPKQE